jgi:hypothetical protein
VTPGNANAITTTAPAGTAAATSVAALSTRSSVSANQAATTTSAVRIPPREYVSSSATIHP